jgi:hypothetical protein
MTHVAERSADRNRAHSSSSKSRRSIAPIRSNNLASVPEYWPLIPAIRRIALSRGDARIAALRVAARTAGDLIAGDCMTVQVAADRLWQACGAYGLVAEFGVDEVQTILSEGFDYAAR